MVLSQIINKRPVFLCLGGISIERMKEFISSFGRLDVCWYGLNIFTPVEQQILAKANKRFDIVFDCSTVVESNFEAYEKVRMARIGSFLARPDNNLWVTSHGIVRDTLSVSQYRDIWTKYGSKILKVDSLFPQDRIPEFMSVPNSATLAIASCIAGGASKIILFGCDGKSGNTLSYFASEETGKERQLAIGNTNDPTIPRNADTFEEKINNLIGVYNQLFNNHCVVYNCSHITKHKSLPIIKYEQVKDII